MSRKVKAGTYWRTIDRGNNIVEVIKLLESGYSNDLLKAVRVGDPNQIVNQVQLNHSRCTYYRCKKNGEWFSTKTTPVQSENRRLLSLEWQAKGALASFCKALREAGNPDAAFMEKYGTSCIAMMRISREQKIRDMKHQALIQKKITP